MRRFGKFLTLASALLSTLRTLLCEAQTRKMNKYIERSVPHRPGRDSALVRVCHAYLTDNFFIQRTNALQKRLSVSTHLCFPGSRWDRRQGITRMGSHLIFFLLWLTPFSTQAQRIWSQVSLDRTTTYVGQPVEVRITVYTSTWFTKGIDLGNIKVNGAFTVYFRPVSRSFQQDGQNYAGVELIYHVFPFDNQDIIFPTLEIEVESPAEGDYKGVTHHLKTTEKRIRVKPVPPNFSEEQWLVATGLTVSDHWSGNPQQVKVGDVLVRSISRTAFGTVGELIPPIAWDSLPEVSMYPARSNVGNQQTKTAISATRSESMRYLFEQEGEVTLPEMVFTWYNPYHQKLYKRTLKEVRLEVKPNPDLGMLASVRDSLEAQQAQEAAIEEDKDQPFTLLGMSPKRFAALAIISMLVLYLLMKAIIRISHWISQRRERYRHSEAYYFDQFKHAVRQNKRSKTIRNLYRWIDELALPEPSVHSFAKKFGSSALQAEVVQLESQIGQEGALPKITINEWEKARKRYKGRYDTVSAKEKVLWINPKVPLVKI